MKTRFFISIIAIALLASCSDNPPSLAKIDVTMKAASTTSTISKSGRLTSTSGRTAATGLIFTEVLLGVTKLEFETDVENEQEGQNGESADEEVEYRGEFVVDLINGTSTPDLGTSNSAPGMYNELEIEVGPILPGGNSIFIAFKVPGSAEPMRVEYSTTADVQFEIERQAGFQLDPGALNQMLVLLNLDLLFEGIDFNQATADPDGVIRINSNSNASIAALVAANLDDAFEAGEDNDDDGEIDG